MVAGIEPVKGHYLASGNGLNRVCRSFGLAKRKTGLALWGADNPCNRAVGCAGCPFLRHWDEIKAAAIAIGADMGCSQGLWDSLVDLAVDIFGAVFDFVAGTWENIKTAASDIGALFGGSWADSGKQSKRLRVIFGAQ